MSHLFYRFVIFVVQYKGEAYMSSAMQEEIERIAATAGEGQHRVLAVHLQHLQD